mgnify:CR=1 FL=1
MCTSILDDTNESIGKKIRNAKVFGIPYIAILGNSTSESELELEFTKDNSKEVLTKEELINKFKELI